MSSKPLRFHWSMSAAGESFKGAKARKDCPGVPNLDAHLEYCRQAEACGMESLLTAFGFHRADPIVMASALGMATEKISFMVAVRSGISSPTSFVQQVNSVSAVTNGRICLNVVGGHTPAEQRSYGDFLEHDDRYERTDEFLTICRAFWEGEEPVNFEGKHYRIEDAKLNTPFISSTRKGPEIYLGGASQQAIDLAARHAACLWTLPKAPEVIRDKYAVLAESDTDVGLLVSLIARETHAEAVDAAQAIRGRFDDAPRKVHKEFSKRSDSTAFNSTLALAEENQSDWVTPYLWTGLVPFMGAPSIALVGSYDEVADGLMIYQAAGVSQFLFMGWPDLEEMARFHQEVEPRVRKREVERERATVETN